MKNTYRYLTENEKEYILNYCHDKGNLPSVYRKPVPYLLIAIATGVFFGYVLGTVFEEDYYFGIYFSSYAQGALIGIFMFLVAMCMIFGIKKGILKGFKNIPKMIDQLEAEEVTYSGSSMKLSGNYSYIWLHMNEGDYKLNDLHICERMEKGAKFIILQMKGQKWVFRARQ